jgi:hypothetical protein
MAKGVHSKRRKRNQSIKRKILDEKMWRPTLEATSKRLFKRTFGKGDDSVITMKKNGFRFPKDPEAEIPQAKAPIFIDRRTSAAPREYLMKEMGTKKKNILKKQVAEDLQEKLRDAEDRALGRVRENEVIDLNDFVKYDEYGNIDMDMDRLEVNEKKKTKNVKKKNNFEDMDLDDTGINRRGNSNTQRRNKKKKKSKSFYLVNY